MAYELLDNPNKGRYELLPMVAKPAESKPSTFGADLQRNLNDIPRQLGLTTRDIIEGGAGTAGMIADPFIGLGNKLLGTNAATFSGAGNMLSNAIGLPQPKNATERVVNDTAKMLVGTGGLIKGATQQSTKVISPIAKETLNFIAARAGLQGAGTLGAGTAGGYTRETGGGAGAQFAASLAGGLGGAGLLGGINSLVKSSGNYISNLLKPQNLDVEIETALKNTGSTWDSLSHGVKQSIRDDVSSALNTGGKLSPDALRRLVDYRAVNATPLRSTLSLNPIDITRDKNAAKVAANSLDPVAQKLPMIQNDNNTALIKSLNNLGANAADDALGAGSKVIGALGNRNNTAKSIIDHYYSKARATDGRSAALDPYAFTNNANDALEQQLVQLSLPAEIRLHINGIAAGKIPLTVDTAELLKTRMGNIQRASSDGNVRTAISIVRKSLDETPLLAGQDIGQSSINAFNKARKLNATYMANVEKTPALQAVREGIEPDKFVNQYIIGSGSKSNVMDVAMLKKNLKGDVEATDAIRGQILSHLKVKALGGASDEVGKFSASNYNKAFNAIGDRKLNLFFTKEEINQMKRVGRVASYEVAQPVGAAVNNSNTASALFSSVFDKIANANIIKSAPWVGDIITNAKITGRAKDAMNLNNSLLSKQQLLQKQKVLPIAPLLSLGLLSN